MKPKTCKSIIWLLFICISCNNGTRLSFTETQIAGDEYSIVFINIPRANESTNVSNNINNAISKTVVNTLSFGDSGNTPNTIEEQIDAFVSEYDSFKEDFPDSAQQWEAQIEGDVMYQSSEIVSIALSSYINTGGAHGISAIVILNFDAKTGMELQNEELFTNNEVVRVLAKPYFENAIKEKEDNTIDPDSYKLPENIGFSEDGVIMLYNAYEIASYATGVIQFTIPYSEISSYLNYH